MNSTHSLSPVINPVVIGVGEILWDLFPDGARFGGAPANFACSAAGLAGGKAECLMVSGLGVDELGDRACQSLRSHGVSTDHVERNEHPTGQVQVSVDTGGHASYEFAEDSAWDNLHWSEGLARLADRADAVCFGSLGQRSTQSGEVILRFIQSTRPDCLRVFDVNLRDPYWTESVLLESLPKASVLKCNEDELPVIASLLGVSGSDTAIVKELIVRYGYRVVALTRGSSGSLLVKDSGELSELPGVAVDLVDTVGAGDAFTAALTLGMLRRMPLVQTHQLASRVSAYVCSQAGATPRLPSELQLPSEFQSFDTESSSECDR